MLLKPQFLEASLLCYITSKLHLLLWATILKNNADTLPEFNTLTLRLLELGHSLWSCAPGLSTAAEHRLL